MSLEGRGRFQSRCSGCGKGSPEYRCRDCTYGPLWCQSCLVCRHAQNPLHVVQVSPLSHRLLSIFAHVFWKQKWNGLFFGRTTLKDLGLRIGLGHAPGRFCASAKLGNKDFVVIHTNGVHTVHLEFCRCTDVTWPIQLLRIGWFPATPLRPQTCATMEVLRHFHTLNLQGKTTAYSYYRSLECLTDSTGLYPPPVSTITIPRYSITNLQA